MIAHVEDLPIKKFVDCVTNLNKFVATEKVDGSELVFGFDDRGKFYTTREHKSGKRYYSENTWPKQFWTTSFRSAHKALESVQNVLKLLMNPGDSVEIEVLFGPQPNTVPYNRDGVNRIIFLRAITGEIDLKKLNDKINAFILRGIKVNLDSIPTTTDGINFITDTSENHQWKFESVPVIKLEKISNKGFSKTINELNQFMNQTSLLEKTNTETAELRVTKTNKFIVEETRLKLQEFKLKIKNHLIESLVENRSSAFGPTIEQGGWVEGLVFRDPVSGFQFKLINKEKFTKMNKENHEVQDYIRETSWKKLKHDLFETLKITPEDRKQSRIYFEDFKDLANKNFETPLRVACAEIQTKCHESLKYLKQQLLATQAKYPNLNESSKQKILQEFSGIRNRICNINSKCFEVSQMEHLIELVLTEDIKADHKKHFTGGARRIYVEEIPKTLKYVSKITSLPLKEIQENVLGSTGKVDSSGDIDIAVDLKKYSKESLIEFIKSNVKDDEIIISGGLDIIHLVVPICGNKSNGFVQVDLMMSENIEWTKFYHTHPGTSNYKGLYRNALLRALTAATNKTKYDNNELTERLGYVLVPSKGIQHQHKVRYEGKNGKYLKTFKVEKRGGIESNPITVLEIIFRDSDIRLEDVQTFESTLRSIKNSNVDETLIKIIATKILVDLKYPIPRELLLSA